MERGRYDWLTFMDKTNGNIILTLFEIQPVQRLTFCCMELLMGFYSDESNVERGFNLTYEVMEYGTDQYSTL